MRPISVPWSTFVPSFPTPGDRKKRHGEITCQKFFNKKKLKYGIFELKSEFPVLFFEAMSWVFHANYLPNCLGLQALLNICNWPCIKQGNFYEIILQTSFSFSILSSGIETGNVQQTSCSFGTRIFLNWLNLIVLNL